MMNKQDKPDIKTDYHLNQIRQVLSKRYGIQKKPDQLSVHQYQNVQDKISYIGQIPELENNYTNNNREQVIRNFKFQYVNWFSKNTCFALGYNKKSQKGLGQGHYLIYDLIDWKMHYKKFSDEEAIVGLLSQEYLNKMFGIGSQGGIYQIEKGQEKFEQRPILQVNVRNISSATYAPTHAKIALGSFDQKIYIYDVTGSIYGDLKGHGKEVTSVDWSPVYSLLLSGSEDESIRLWDPRSLEEVVSLKRHNLGVKKVKINNQYFLTTDEKYQTLLFDLRQLNKEMYKLPRSQALCWNSKYDNIFYLGDHLGAITSWNVSAPNTPIFQAKKNDTQLVDIAMEGQFMACIRQRLDKPDQMEVYKVS